MARLTEARIEEIDRLLRAGRAAEARRHLADWRRDKPPRRQLVPVAALARRAGYPSLSLRLLNPIVRPPANAPRQATDAERAEYAAALVRVGAVDEGLAMLSALDGNGAPDAWLFRAFAHVGRWEYAEAIAPLRRYLETETLTPYARLVGEVNLAAALVHERHHAQARALLGVLRESTRAPGRELLLGNSLELSAQQAVLESRWEEADGYLGEAERLLRGGGGLDELFVRKWKAVAMLLRHRGRRGAEALGAVRDEARRRGHWETWRDCDFFEAVARRDTALARRLWHGTPYRSYRARLVEELGAVIGEGTYRWRPGHDEAPSRRAPELDLSTGEVPRGEPLKVGQARHRLMSILASDFYRPLRLATIHAKLYPESYFNPTSSPTRVHQAMKRLKRWLESTAPMAVEEEEGSYRLVARRELAVRVGGEGAGDREGGLLRVLASRAGTRSFSMADAAAWLGTSSRSALRVVQRGMGENRIERQGRTAGASYRFLQNSR